MKLGSYVEFTEDEWTTSYKGTILQISEGSYLIRSYEYGTFYIPKVHTRLISEPMSYEDMVKLDNENS